MERFIGRGHEEVFGAPGGRTREIAAVFNNTIQHLTIVSGDIFHITHIFIAPFNLKGAHAGVDQCRQVGGLIVIFHRQQMFFIGHNAPLVVFQGVRQAASLRAVAAVGATSGLRVRNIALA